MTDNTADSRGDAVDASVDDKAIGNHPAEARSNQAGETDDNKRSKKFQRIVQILLVLPYVMGIVWTSLHPVVSVLTGEAKCRGWYLDEHSIGTYFVDSQTSPLAIPHHFLQDRTGDAATTLCDHFPPNQQGRKRPPNLICHSHGDFFDVAMVVPLSNALDATEEAIVFVLPYPPTSNRVNTSSTHNWASSNMHVALIQALRHLADPVATPWLAKTILVVTPNRPNVQLEDTLTFFLNAHLGPMRDDYDRSSMTIMPSKAQSLGLLPPPLPPRLSAAILRTLIVIDVDDQSTTKASQGRSKPDGGFSGCTNLSILPQGRRGVLPNADLVFLVGKMMERASFMNQKFYPSTNNVDPISFLTHPFTQESRQAAAFIERTVNNHHMYLDKKMSPIIKEWAKDLVNLALCARTMAVGPVPPHAAALDRGIDSLTIRVKFDGAFRRDPSVELMQYVEYLVRSLSNLHERLHHSLTLYLLPTPRKFVSHIEYFLPNILLLLPLAVRAFGLLLPAMKEGCDLTVIGGSMLVTGVALVTPLFWSMFPWNTVTDFDTNDASGVYDIVLLVICLAVAIFWIRRMRQTQGTSRSCSNEINDDSDDSSSNLRRSIRSLQFATCVLAAYILVPIAFAHTSLSYFPSMMWTPLLAFPDYSAYCISKRLTGTGRWFFRLIFLPLMSAFVLATAPPILLVPRIFATYTPFVQFAYLPLHLHFFLLVVTTWFH